MPSFKCEDIGLDCGFQAQEETKEALLTKVADHAKTVHNMDPIPDDVMAKVQGAIQ